MLAKDAAVAVLAQVGVMASRISSGGVGPPEFYPSQQAYLEALLRSRLPKPPRQ